jgi:IS30 family transposase
MSGYSHLSAEERDRIAGLKADGLSLGAISRALGRAPSTISREIGRNGLESGAYRPHVADGAYMLRRQRKATIETDAKLAAYVTDRLTEGWTPEQIAGRLRLGIERDLRAVCAETIYGWIYRAGQKAERLWRFLTRHHARRRKRHGRASRDTIAEKTHISRRSDDADARRTAGHWPFGDAGIACRLAGGRPRDLQTLPAGAGAARAQDPDHADDAPGRQDRG